MKKINMFLVTLLALTSFAHAANIEGLDSAQIKDLNKCLRSKGLTFDELNQMQNDIQLGLRSNNKISLYHNFTLRNDELGAYGNNAFSNAVIASGMFFIGQQGEQSFDDSVLANVTFIGNYKNLSFKNACLVNVRFDKAGTFTLMRIRSEANSAKNISY